MAHHRNKPTQNAPIMEEQGEENGRTALELGSQAGGVLLLPSQLPWFQS